MSPITPRSVSPITPRSVKGLSPHLPSVCLPGGGWLITTFERTAYGKGDSGIPINRVIIEQDRAKQLVYYWFDERGRKIADEWWAKWYLLTDAITMKTPLR
jgi:EpsI family protein